MTYHRITVKPGGKSFDCAESQVVFEAMKQAGGPVLCGCFGGGCGVCKMKVLSGEFQVIQNMSRAHVTSEEQEQGFILLCSIQPCTDLVLSKI